MATPIALAHLVRDVYGYTGAWSADDDQNAKLIQLLQKRLS